MSSPQRHAFSDALMKGSVGAAEPCAVVALARWWVAATETPSP
jgi:hypothetical protein